MSITRKDFSATNQTVEKMTVAYIPNFIPQNYEVDVVAGTLTQSAVGQFINLDATGTNVNASSLNSTYGQLRVEEVRLNGLFAVVSINNSIAV